MAKIAEVSNVIRVGPSSARGADLSVDDKDASVKNGMTLLYRKYMSAVKIIVVAGITEAADFLNDYSNYENTAKVLGDGEVPCSESDFDGNRIKAWADLMVALVVMLKDFPQSHMTVERVESVKSDYGGEKSLDHYFLMSFSVVTEAYDWKSHLVEVLIPEGLAKRKTLVLIDGEPVFVLD